MHGLAQPEEPFPPNTGEGATVPKDRPGTAGSVADRSKVSDKLEGMELDAALQLLVERAQYITGATGTALALAQGNEMVCRASAGASAPAVGARLQVQSGLTGESVARRQLLRCDNAETDPRVNLEACRALGIASIVVLPLQRRNGEVSGLFELFSDHPYAFEERDLTALERMADLTMTALDLAEQRQSSEPARGRPQEAGAAPSTVAAVVSPPTISVPPQSPVSSLSSPSLLEPQAMAEMTAASSVPAAMLRVQKCASCGFPVSEGRTLCLDCEKKDGEKKDFDKKQRVSEQVEIKGSEPAPEPAEQGEYIPAFLANSVPAKESWLSNHVNLLAIIVLILCILVAVVVFR
jgi:putative methionine-R-sulfoxide reductase with GAF domain